MENALANAKIVKANQKHKISAGGASNTHNKTLIQQQKLNT